MTVTEITLAVVILVVGSMFAYQLLWRGRKHSPFELLGVAPGMSVRELRKRIVDEKHGMVNCRREYEAYQSCVLKFSPDPGVVTAVLDPDGRVIVVEAIRIVGQNGLTAEVEKQQPEWSRVAEGISAPPLYDRGDTGAVRWTSRDERWWAELHFNGGGDAPTQVLMADASGVATLAKRSPKGAEDAKQSGWIHPTPEEAKEAFERHRANRALDFGTMATSLSMLADYETAHFNVHHAYTDNLADFTGMTVPGGALIEIMIATDSGWTAKATHPAFPGYSCVTYGGRVQPIDWPITARGRHITTSEGVSCDALPPLDAPSLGDRPE
jgi:hypothetical protein